MHTSRHTVMYRQYSYGTKEEKDWWKQEKVKN